MSHVIFPLSTRPPYSSLTTRVQRLNKSLADGSISSIQKLVNTLLKKAIFEIENDCMSTNNFIVCDWILTLLFSLLNCLLLEKAKFWDRKRLYKVLVVFMLCFTFQKNLQGVSKLLMRWLVVHFKFLKKTIARVSYVIVYLKKVHILQNLLYVSSYHITTYMSLLLWLPNRLAMFPVSLGITLNSFQSQASILKSF